MEELELTRKLVSSSTVAGGVTQKSGSAGLLLGVRAGVMPVKARGTVRGPTSLVQTAGTWVAIASSLTSSLDRLPHSAWHAGSKSCCQGILQGWPEDYAKDAVTPMLGEGAVGAESRVGLGPGKDMGAGCCLGGWGSSATSLSQGMRGKLNAIHLRAAMRFA